MSKPGDAASPLVRRPCLSYTRIPRFWRKIPISPQYCWRFAKVQRCGRLPWPGRAYPDVSRAYFEAVHAVLSHKKSASQAAADLQQELAKILEEICGFARTQSFIRSRCACATLVNPG